jgi:predicted ATPase/class 3 adenylate cyclase
MVAAVQGSPRGGESTQTLTFLFTDVEGSTAAWLRNPSTMGAALARHDELIENIVSQHGGHVVRPRGEGDSRFAVFRLTSDALKAACAIQRALLTEPWALDAPLRARIAIHTGECTLRNGDYYGPSVNHCARLRAAAHGGQVLVSDVSAALVSEARPTEITLRDLGPHQLKDLEHPERIWQVLHRDLPAEFPPLASKRVSPLHNLPEELSSFIGRSEAVAEARRLLTESRLITLVGPGGIGKTRLALRVAAEMGASFRDGVWLARLDSLNDPDLVPVTVAAVLGVDNLHAFAADEAVASTGASRELLLVLDNCEHVADVAAEVADLLLAHCRGMRILATSREPLRVAGEVTVRVGPLSLPAADHAQRVDDSEAIRLFIERARARNRGFSPTEENLPALGEVCRRLDGLPLAIELAAARTTLLTPEQLVARLTRRFDLLSAGNRTALPRHQTLRGAIQWSYELLSDRERIAFDRLSVFAAGWTIDGAEAVCADGLVLKGDVLELLGLLVDRSLVVVQDVNALEPRYRFLETLREYAREKLAERGETDVAFTRYVDYFIALGEGARPHLSGGQLYANWLQRLEADKDNLLAAMRWCLERHDVDRALRLGGAVWRFWYVRRALGEANVWLEALLEVLSGPARTATRARALNGAGVLASQQGDYDRAQSLHQESLSIVQELGERELIATSFNNLGMLALFRRDFTSAQALLEESLAVTRETGNEVRYAIVVANLASLYESQGEYARARGFYAESVACYRRAHDRLGMSMGLSQEGHVALAEDDVEAAQARCEESLDLARDAGHNGAIAVACLELGLVRLRHGDITAARALFRESLSVQRGPRHADERTRIPRCLVGLAGVDAAEGRPERALTLISAAEQAHARFVSRAGVQRVPAPVVPGVSASNLARPAPDRWTGPFDRQSIESCIATARAMLSADGADAAWQRGAALSLPEAVAHALAKPAW